VRYQGAVWTMWTVASLLARPGAAQFKSGNQSVLLRLPTISPRAEVTERIGLTDITVVYHRPQVGGRKILGRLVPYGEVWRTGANDNTTIAFTDPVRIDGHELPAGRYGVHTIPGEDEWTVIFSRNSTSWGSFSYDSAEDVLRVAAKPVANPFHEALTFEFGELKADTVTLRLEWDDWAVPLEIAVDSKPIVLRSIRDQLRHLPGYKAEAWNDAATYCLDNQFNYEEALRWTDHALAMEETSFALLNKVALLERLGRQLEAGPIRDRALELGDVVELYQYGVALLGEKRIEDALSVFEKNRERNPDSWIALMGVGRGAAARGDRPAALRSLQGALARAPRAGNKKLIQSLLDRLEKGEALD